MVDVVGTAGVRIRPLTDAFRTDTQAEVDKATAGVTGTVGIKVDDTRIKALQADLSALSKRTWTTTVATDDVKARAQIDRYTAQLEKLGRTVAKPNVSLQGYTKAIAEMAAIRAGLTDLDVKAKESSSSGGGLFRLNGMIESLGNLSTAGPALFNPLVVGLAALAAIMAGPLLASLLPITAGFGLLALAGKSAIDGLNKKWKDLDPQQREIKKGLDDVKSSFAGLLKSIQPEVLNIFAIGLDTIKQLLPALKPLLKAAADAAEQFLTNVSEWLSSPSGKKFLNWLETQGPKDIKTFGEVLWSIAQIAGRTFSFLNNAGNTWWHNVSHVFDDVRILFVKDFPGWLEILKDDTKIVWDKMEIDALTFVDNVVSAFAMLPGPMGQPFKDAKKNIETTLANLKISVAKDEGDIQSTLDSLHGHSVQLNFGLGLPAGVTIPGARTGQRTAGHAAGTGGAAPGWAWVGERGPELVAFKGGETVVPHHASMKMAGYAAGTPGWEVTGEWTPSVAAFDREMTAAFNATEAAIVSAVNKTAQMSLGSGGSFGNAPAGSGPYQAYARSLFPRFGWGQDQWTPFNAIVMQESGWNPNAQNPTSTAYGIGQFLDTTWATVGATKTSNPYAQIWDMEEYIKGRYGNPAAAEAFHLANNSYAKGTKTSLNKQIERALSVVRHHPGEPQKYTKAEIELQSWIGRVAQDRQLRRAGRHHVGLAADERHVRQLRRAIAPMAADRKTVRNVRGHLATQEAALRHEIGTAHARGMGGLAGTLTHRLNRDLDAGKTMGNWLNRLGPSYGARAKATDARWVNSLINKEARGLGLPIGTFDKGGYLPTGLSMAYNGTGRPERVGNGPTEIKVSMGSMPKNTTVERFLGEMIRSFVFTVGGGDVAVALGRAG